MEKVTCALVFMAAVFNMTLNIFKHRYVLANSRLSFIHFKHKTQIYMACQIKTDMKFRTVRTQTCNQDAILFKEECAIKC
jgi:hypothetical protein